MHFATGVLAKGGKVVVTGLIGGAYSTAVAMFPLKAMTIEGTTTGTLAEARELIDLVRAKLDSPATNYRAANSIRRQKPSMICAQAGSSGASSSPPRASPEGRAQNRKVRIAVHA